MSYVIALLMLVITTMLAIFGYLSKGVIKWVKSQVEEHIKGENEFRKYVKDEIKKINETIDFFIKDLKPTLDKIDRLPEVERGLNDVKMDIKKIKHHVNYHDDEQV